MTVARSRRLGTVLLSAGAVVLTAAAISWACTPQASISVSPGSGLPGSQATVSGSAFTTGPVTIRWGSASGPVIGSAVGPSFSASVTIPSGAAPDVYYIVASGAQGRASVPFEVVGSPGGGPTTPGGGGNDSGGGGPTTGGGGSGGGNTTPGAGNPGSSPGTTSGGRTTRGGSTSNTTSGGGGEGRTTSGRSRGSRGTSALPNPGRGAPAGNASRDAVVTRSGERVFAGSVPAVERKSSAKGAKAAPAAKASERSASSDLWSGFSSPERSSLAAIGSDGSPVEDGRSSALTLGLAMLGLGLVGMAGGFLVAAARRRRAEAGAAASDDLTSG